MTALEKFRKAAAEREKKHAEIEKNISKDGSGMTSAIDRLEKHLNKEETHSPENRGGADSYYGRPYDNPHKVGSQEHKDYHKGYYGTEFGQKDYGAPRGAPKNRMREEAGVSKNKETQFHKKIDQLVHKTFGKRKEEMNKEDAPVNATGSGTIAGLGVGPQGEPGVNMKKKKKVIPFAMFTRKMPD